MEPGGDGTEPGVKRYGYRFTLLHIASFPLLLFDLALIYGLATILSHTSSQQGAESFRLFGEGVMLIFLACLAFPVYLQLKSWNERIVLDERGIVWIDFLGRTRVQADLSEIKSLSEATHKGVESEYRSLTVKTMRGTIVALEGIRGYADLKAQLERAVGQKAQAIS